MLSGILIRHDVMPAFKFVAPHHVSAHGSGFPVTWLPHDSPRKGLGVVNLEGLLGFNFASLQKRYFQFMLPTFDTSHAGYADRFWEKRRQQRFLKTGVVGLQVMDEERRRLLKAARPALVRRLRVKGEPLAPAPRTGIGRNGTLVSYQDLNDRVAMALRKLLERERRLLA